MKTPDPEHFTVGATYKHEETGFIGVAQVPDKPVTGKAYRSVEAEPRQLISVGPHPTAAGLWAVAEDGPDGLEVFWADRSLLPLNWPRVGLQSEAGPKGAPERRYFDIDDLTPED